MSLSRKAKQAIVVAILLNLCTGAQYVWNLCGRQLIAEANWTALQATLPYTVLFWVTSLWAIIAGKFVDNQRSNWGTFLGGICTFIGLLLCALSQSFIVIMIGVGIFLGLSSTSVTSNTSSTAMRFTPMKYKGLVAGLCTAGVALSSFYLAPIFQSLLKNVGLKGTFLSAAIGLGALICILSIFLPNPPKVEEGLSEGKDEDFSLYHNKITPFPALKRYETWVIFLCFACAGMSGQILVSQMANIAKVQANYDQGFILVMTLAIGNASGRLLVSSLSDRLGCFHTWKVISIVNFVNAILFPLYKTPGMLIFGSILVGMFYGASVPLTWASVAAVYGKKYMGGIYGYVTNGFAVAATVGPIIAATVFDSTGSYNGGFIAVALFQIVGLVLAFTVKDSKKYRDIRATEVAVNE
jgi:MFS family permease